MLIADNPCLYCKGPSKIYRERDRHKKYCSNKCAANHKKECNPMDSQFRRRASKIKQRALEYRREYAIDWKYLKSIWTGYCALSTKEISLFTKDLTKLASIDRIDNTKGYVPGNVQWVSISENSKKGTKTVREYNYRG